MEETPYGCLMEKWASCSKTWECVLVRDPCDKWVTVNRAFVLEYEEWRERVLWHCALLSDTSAKPEVVCRNQQCRIPSDPFWTTPAAWPTEEPPETKWWCQETPDKGGG